MGSLTPSDVKRWDLNAIHAVFETAGRRADTLQHLGDSLQQAQNVLADWQGEGGDAFRADVGKIRRDIEADGAESKQVAAAVSRAEVDVNSCKQELAGIQQAVEYNGWTITPDWRIDVGNNAVGRDPIKAAALQKLQDDLNACKVHAHNADHELATAIGAAVGEVPLGAVASAPRGTQPPQGAPNPSAGGKPKTWQDMLLPAGPADPTPGGVPPKDPPLPAGAEPGGAAPNGPPVPAGAGGKPKTWQDMLLPAGPADGGSAATPPKGPPAPAATGGKPRTWKDMLLPAGAGAPPPRLDPADVESFKAMARQNMISDGVPPDQIEARLNDVVRGEQGIENLIGNGGPGAPSALESWDQLLKGIVERAQNPFKATAEEIAGAVNSPSASYYLGERASDAAFAVPGLIFGPEAAGAGEVADIGAGALDIGPVVGSHVPVGFENPVTYHSWAEGAATDLNHAFSHGGPTAGLSQQLADMATHYVGDNPDRVVLGKFDGHEGGYIGEARDHGGIYYDTGAPAWDAVGQGLGPADADALGWQVNEQFLRTHMENGVSRIEYVLNSEYPSLEAVLVKSPDSFSAKEIEFLVENGQAYGYRRVGNAWVRD